MDVFTHQGLHFISINGKDYFLIRGYRKNYRNYVFLQVHGKTPLRKEDLPSKDWEIITTKSADKRVYTAFVKRYFQYNSERENPHLAFVGASTDGSFYLALSHISKRFSLNVEISELRRLANLYDGGELKNRHLDRVRDDGNSGVEMIVVSFDQYFKEEDAHLIFREAES